MQPHLILSSSLLSPFSSLPFLKFIFTKTHDKGDPRTTKYTSLSTGHSSSDTQTTSVTLVTPAEEVETPGTLSSV